MAPREQRDFDVVIVGAGLAGSATALRLAERRPDLRVALVDAACPGGGSSGRGTGLLGPRFGPPIDVARRRFGDGLARALFERSERAVQEVVELAVHHAPEALAPCHGQLVTGFTSREQAAVRRRAQAYLELGLDVPLVSADAAALPAAAAAPALHYRTAAGLDPAALTRGIARAAKALGVSVLDNTTVHQLADQRGRRTRLATSRGDFEARAVIVTVDAAAPGLIALPSLLELEVCAQATAVLPPQVLAALGGPTAAHVLAASPLGAYRRFTPDGRLVIGGGPMTAWRGLGASALARRRDAAWVWQRSWLDRIHPALGEVSVTHRWSGRITVTADALPVLGRLPGLGEVWYAGGWNGHGLSARVAAAARLAEAILSHPAGRRRALVSAGLRNGRSPNGRATTETDPGLLWGPARPWALARPVVAPAVRGYLATRAASPRAHEWARDAVIRPGSTRVSARPAHGMWSLVPLSSCEGCCPTTLAAQRRLLARSTPGAGAARPSVPLVAAVPAPHNRGRATS